MGIIFLAYQSSHHNSCVHEAIESIVLYACILIKCSPDTAGPSEEQEVGYYFSFIPKNPPIRSPNREQALASQKGSNVDLPPPLSVLSLRLNDDEVIVININLTTY